MDSKILFRNETTYTPEIALEAGDAFWKIQPAYRKKAKRFKILSGILSLTFLILAIMVIRENGIGIAPIGALVMSVMGALGFIKGESIIKNSAKNLRAMDTRVTYGISENFFFVLNREYIKKEKSNIQEKLKAPEEEDYEQGEDSEEEIDDDITEENAVGKAETCETDDGADEDDYSENEYADEFLSLEDLLVCVVTENLYILIWEKPYYILDRRRFEGDKDKEFRTFIEEKTDIIEA